MSYAKVLAQLAIDERITQIGTGRCWGEKVIKQLTADL